MGSRTPVSILQELMIQKGEPPHYDLIHDSTGMQETIFKYRVYAGTVSAIGTGRSKKEAKHDAARQALERLADPGVVSTIPRTIPQEIPEVTLPYKDKLTENAVGTLHEMCESNELPLPEYELVGDEGPPHARQFTFVCSVSKMKETGVGWTKKRAKHLAASNMYARLRESLGDHLDVLPSDTIPPSENNEKSAEDTKSRAAVAKYMELGHPVRRESMCQRVSDIHMNLMHLKCDSLDRLREDPNLIETGDALSVAQDIADELDVQLLWQQMQHNTPGKIFTTLLLMTIPEAAIPGTGSSVEEAKENAAKDLLKFLLIMTRDVVKDKSSETKKMDVDDS